MNILIDIGHPAHVHYFKNLYHELKIKHKVIVTCKSVEIIKNLLAYNDIPFLELGEKGVGVMNKIKKQIGFTRTIVDITKKESIDLCIGVSATIIHAAKLAKINAILFDDDDLDAQFFVKHFVAPYSNITLSPDSLSYEKKTNTVYYPGLHELAYLHPNRFTPNIGILNKYELTENEDYFILRFNAFNAHHDIKEGGMSMRQKQELVKLLSSKGKVFITTEAKIDPEFEQYKLPIPPHEIHDFLYYAKMFVSDSQTMTSEASVLGVPSFRCNSFVGRLSVIEEEEKKYGLTFGFLPRQFNWMLARIESLLSEPDLKKT